MGRFFAAIARFFSFVLLRRSEDIRQAADEQFTGSTEGIRAAFAIERDNLARDFRNLQEAVAGVLNVAEDRKAQLENLDQEEEQLKVRVEGALTAADQAQSAGNEAELSKAREAYQRYRSRLAEIDDLQDRLINQVAEVETSLDRHLLRLTELKAQLQRLPQQEAEAIADFVSAREITELNNRLMNAQDGLRESPVAAVRERVRQMSSQARITEKLVGADAKLQDTEYERLGRETAAGDDFEAVLAARKELRARGSTAAPEAESTAPEASPEPERPRL